jgi:1-phosphofructokinase family hexose kinase
MTGNTGKIITIGLCPCWDIFCRGPALEWGQHSTINNQSVQPAGKALNVSRALAWLGRKNTAAGLWGQFDYLQMREKLSPLRKLIKINLTCVPGQTRSNVALIDTRNRREMHLRAPSTLASSRAMRQLRNELKNIVRKDSICVFSGSLPDGELLDDVLSLIKTCRDRQAKLVIDTSGKPLKAIMALGGIWLVKPNVTELRELLGPSIKDNPAALARAAGRLLDQAQIILISRGARGALALTRKTARHASLSGPRREVFSTVGCGDYLLAGFLYGLSQNGNLSAALRYAIKTATARAWDMTEQSTWPQLRNTIPVKIQPVLFNT